MLQRYGLHQRDASVPPIHVEHALTCIALISQIHHALFGNSGQHDSSLFFGATRSSGAHAEPLTIIIYLRNGKPKQRRFPRPLKVVVRLFEFHLCNSRHPLLIEVTYDGDGLS